MWLIWLLLIMPGMICLYALVIRGMLAKVEVLKNFYAQADTFWEKVWAICGNSLTIVWAHIVGGVGTVLASIDPIAAMLGDPEFKTQISETLQTNPKVLGYILMGISFITIFARMRSLMKA